MTRPRSDVLAAAREDHASVVDLMQSLVRTPSRAGIDRYDPILSRLSVWLKEHGLDGTPIRDANGETVALSCEVQGSRPGPCWVLNACLDTAPFGEETAWTHPPTSGLISDGWLWGRGAADSKAGVAIFSHIAARLSSVSADLRGRLVLLFDVDEHTGGFGGAKHFFEAPDAPRDIAGVMIGYPGLDKLVVGSRGVVRARITVYGVASHSGGSVVTPSAIQKAAYLVQALASLELPADPGGEFPLPGKLTVTTIEGGHGYTVTPDICTLGADIRTTPTFDGHGVTTLLKDTIAELDVAWPDTRPTRLDIETCWPAYALTPDAQLPSSILAAAGSLGLELEPKIVGPSNIGNYLAGLGIPATAGFGVTYLGLHSADERIHLDSIPTVQAVYHATLLELLT